MKLERIALRLPHDSTRSRSRLTQLVQPGTDGTSRFPSRLLFGLVDRVALPLAQRSSHNWRHELPEPTNRRGESFVGRTHRAGTVCHRDRALVLGTRREPRHVARSCTESRAGDGGVVAGTSVLHTQRRIGPDISGRRGGIHRGRAVDRANENPTEHPCPVDPRFRVRRPRSRAVSPDAPTTIWMTTPTRSVSKDERHAPSLTLRVGVVQATA